MVISLNHRTAPVAVRERFWISENRRSQALSRLVFAEGVEEIIVLVSERVMSSWIEHAYRDDEELAQLFDRLTRSEMLRIISSYAARLH